MFGYILLVLCLFVFAQNAQAQQTSILDNSTAPFIFNALSAALTQWPNTYHANGHSVIPGILEPFTLLYHARKTAVVPPPSPEWLAFDPEMSYGIMAVVGGQTYMVTYQNTRPVKVLYFDGMSAGLTTSLGWLDAEDVIIARKGESGGPREYSWWDEYARARRLCEWAQPRGVEGVVRMNSGFELMWCDFASPSIQLVSHLNVTTPGTPPSTRRPWPPGVPKPSDPGRDGTSGRSDPGRGGPPDHYGGGSTPPRWDFDPPAPLAMSAFPEWLRAAARRAVTPQAHIKLDYASFVTFYHPRLHSLASAREAQPMRQHRIWPNISEADAQSVVDELDSVLSRRHSGSYMDWGALARDIVEFWADRVVQLHDLLANTTAALHNNTTVNVTESTAAVRRLTYSPLNPYMDTAMALNASAWDLFFGLELPVQPGAGIDIPQLPFGLPHPPTSRIHTTALQRCVRSSTSLLDHNPYIHKTTQEELLQTSVETILQRLCTDFGIVFAESMDADDTPSKQVALKLFALWNARIVALMEYLDWTAWLRCDEVCPRDNVCTMPLWPITSFRPQGRPDDWKPRCFSLIPEPWDIPDL